MRLFTPVLAALLLAAPLRSEVKVIVDHNDETASPAFKFKNVPAPRRGDAGTNAVFTLLGGLQDPASPGMSALFQGGALPKSEDDPRENFFFAPATAGGRILVDLKSVIPLEQVNSYSWHPSDRGPQVYTLYAKASVQTPPTEKTDLVKDGWTKIARVDTRSNERPAGGQYGVSIRDSSGKLGDFRYLVFDIERTENRDPFGNTFYSEIDFVPEGAPAEEPAAEAQSIQITANTPDKKYHFTFDLTQAPDLQDWTREKLTPVVVEWYPKIVAMLPSEGFTEETNILIRFRTDMGGTPASAGGNRVNCNVQWFRRNLNGEAAGSVVHELVHVVQSYGWGRRRNPGASRTPGWVTEGIPDYIRWFLYEPHTKGAEITERNLERAKYDASYRITGNFLNWVAQKHTQDVIWKVNAAARNGKYSDEVWKELTGKTIEELGAAWKAEHEQRLGKSAASEKKEGG